MLIIHQFACLKDNYGFIIEDQATGKIASIDTPDADAIEAEFSRRGGKKLDFIFNTHWQPDHAGGNAALKSSHDLKIYGPEEVRRIAPLDHDLKPGDVMMFGETRFEIIDLKGHTLGQVGYYSVADGVVFVGDCLFTLGCGRLFEGTAQDMWDSLDRLMALPDETQVYCAHEYTKGNLDFALSVSQSPALSLRAEALKTKIAQGVPTVPTTVGEERLTNPFITETLKRSAHTERIARFAELRSQKDQF